MKNVMKKHIDFQVIAEDGTLEFTVVPDGEFMPPVDDEPTIPHDVVGLTVKNGHSLIRAWRKYLNMTQGDVAAKIGVTQLALAQMEKPGAKLRKATLAKLTAAFSCLSG